MKGIQDRIIAAAVVATTLALGFVLLAAIGVHRVEGNSRKLTIDFPRVDDITPNVTEIKLAGLSIGIVTEVRILTPAERRDLRRAALARDPHADEADLPAVRITARVEATTPLGAQTTASIRQASLMSEHFIELAPGPPDADPLPQETIIAGATAKGLNDLMDPGAEVLLNLRAVTAQAKAITGDLNGKLPVILAKLDDTLGNAKSLTGNLATEESRAQLREILANVRTATAALKSLTDNFEVITANLKVVSTHAKLVAATLAQRPWRLMFGGKPNEIPDEQRIIASKKPVPVKPAEGAR
jgi:ABC-type transporter Mla subunit MlaD